MSEAPKCERIKGCLKRCEISKGFFMTMDQARKRIRYWKKCRSFFHVSCPTFMNSFADSLNCAKSCYYQHHKLFIKEIVFGIET